MNEQTMKDQVETALQAALPSIVEGLKKELTQTVSWEVKNQVTRQVVETVTSWVQVEIVPEIHRILTEEKEGLIALAPNIGQEVVNSLSVALQETFTKKLEHSWERQKIFEALFK